jgi:hypothetical protein
MRNNNGACKVAVEYLIKQGLRYHKFFLSVKDSPRIRDVKATKFQAKYRVSYAFGIMLACQAKFVSDNRVKFDAFMQDNPKLSPGRLLHRFYQENKPNQF